MILKLLLVVGVIAVVYFMFIKKKPLTQKDTPQKKQNKQAPANELVKCETCGVYSDLDDSVLSNAKYYCSSECASKAVS
jgi:uncharacterized protein